MTLKRVWTSAFALTIALSAQFAHAAGPVARVNGTNIGEAEMTFAENEVGSEIAGLPVEARRRVLLEYLVEAHLFADAAAKAQLGQGKEYEERLAYYKLRALRDTFYEKKIREAVTEAQAKAAYDEQIKTIKPEEEIRVRHILLKTEQEAKDIVKQLKAGANFVDLVKKSSDGPSAATGGDLGFFARGQMVKPFEDVAFALKPGEVSEPVQTEFGWHVIKMEERRNRPIPSFDEVKEQLMSSLVQNQLKTVVQGLRSTAKIEVLDPALKKAMDDDAKAAAADAAPEQKQQ